MQTVVTLNVGKFLFSPLLREELVPTFAFPSCKSQEDWIMCLLALLVNPFFTMSCSSLQRMTSNASNIFCRLPEWFLPVYAFDALSHHYQQGNVHSQSKEEGLIDYMFQF
jgi:hypothetical protein